MRLNALFDEPRPLNMFINEVMEILAITQQELAAAAGLSQTAISHLANRKTTSPSNATLGKIRDALVETYGADPDRATFEFLLACRSITAKSSADQVDTRFLEIDEWLRTQPDIVQENFWNIVQAFKNSHNMEQ